MGDFSDFDLLKKIKSNENINISYSFGFTICNDLILLEHGWHSLLMNDQFSTILTKGSKKDKEFYNANIPQNKKKIPITKKEIIVYEKKNKKAYLKIRKNHLKINNKKRKIRLINVENKDHIERISYLKSFNINTLRRTKKNYHDGFLYFSTNILKGISCYIYLGSKIKNDRSLTIVKDFNSFATNIKRDYGTEERIINQLEYWSKKIKNEEEKNGSKKANTKIRKKLK